MSIIKTVEEKYKDIENERERARVELHECDIVLQLHGKVIVNGMGEVVTVEIPESQIMTKDDDPEKQFIYANRDTIAAALVLGSAGAVPEEYKKKIKVGN